MDENPYEAPQTTSPDGRPRRWLKRYQLTTLQANLLIGAVWASIIGILAWSIFQPLR